MSISRTLMVLVAATAPVMALAQHAEPAPAGDIPIVLRPTVGNDSLWTIMKPTVATGQVTHSQAVVAVLRQNPQAFVRGNLHALRKGVVLTIPTLAQIKAESRAKADHLVNAHLRIYEEGLTEASPAPYPLQAGAASASATAASAPVAVWPAAPAQGGEASVAASAPAPVVKAPAPNRAASKESTIAASAATPPIQAPVPAASVSASAPWAVPKVPVAPASPASVPAAPPSVVASAPESTEVPQGGSFSGLYLAGVVLAAAAAGGWLLSRRRSSAVESVTPEIEPAPSPEPRLVQISTAAADMARSLDAMQPVYDLVRPAAPDASVPVEADLSADAALKLELARACIEVRRHDEAYGLLQFVLKHGSEAQQQEAHGLLRGSD